MLFGNMKNLHTGADLDSQRAEIKETVDACFCCSVKTAVVAPKLHKHTNSTVCVKNPQI